MFLANCTMDDLSVRVAAATSSNASSSSPSASGNTGPNNASGAGVARLNPKFHDMDSWWAGVAEEELFYYSSIDYEIESLFAVVSSFVPPPPRPPYLPEETLPTDGLTTCDLCSWALRNDRYSFSLDGTLEAPGEIGWVLTLIIVSLISAGIGAVVMVTLLHCRRLKSAGGRASCCGVRLESAAGSGAAAHHLHHHHHRSGDFHLHQRQQHHQQLGRGAVVETGLGLGGGPSPGTPSGGLAVIPDRPPLELDKLPPYHDVEPSAGHNVNVWSWLGSRRGGGAPGCGVSTPLALPQHRRALNTLPVENHYTHMQTDEALYAELDSQAASYASGSDDKHYHELDALGLQRQHLQQDTLCSRHSQRLEEPDYELYENGPSLTTLHRHHGHHHQLQHQQHQQHQQYGPIGSGLAGGTGRGGGGSSSGSSLGKRHHHQHPHAHQQHHKPPESGQPSYQNTAYTGSDAEQDGPSTLSSAPSSAYYSDLSSSSALPQQHQGQPEGDAPPVYETACQYRLSAINEAASPACSSDYI